VENWFEESMKSQYLINEFNKKVYEKDDLKIVNRSKTVKKNVRNSWISKRLYRKKVIRKFLLLNPSMKIKEIEPLNSVNNVIWLDKDAFTNGKKYNINHVNHMFLNKRGHIEVFTGRLEWCPNGGCFGMEPKNKKIGHITNRRIRYLRTDANSERMNYIYYKKNFSPKIMDII